MPRALKLAVAAASVPVLAAQCPNEGLAAHDRCWYLSEAGKTCMATCEANGVEYLWHVAGAEDPMVPRLLGRAPRTKQFSWARTECYVPQADRYHTAKTVADSNAADAAEPGAWSVDICRLACPCRAASLEPYPSCVAQNTVLRHAGAHAIFVDLTSYGSSGCWQNDCKHSDKFSAQDPGICARTCAELSECMHWAFGEQDGGKKCFFRKSDEGREASEGWLAAAKACRPPAIPAAVLAREASAVLRACDGGKSDVCLDMGRAAMTWKFAIKNLMEAVGDNVDSNTMRFLTQVATDTDAFLSQMNEQNFPVVTGNNRKVFNALEGFLASQPPTMVDRTDASLPNPLRGRLCGPNTCYEKL